MNVCGAFTDRNVFLSKRSPPLGFIVAVTALPLTEKLNRYSPPGCFSGLEASTNLNKPQLPWNVFGMADGAVVRLDDGVSDVFDPEDDVDVGVEPPLVETRLSRTPVSADWAAGKVPLIDPVPSDVIF